jgi:hypothetical protein
VKSNIRRVDKGPHSGLSLLTEFIQETGTNIWCTRVFHGTDVGTTLCLSVPHFFFWATNVANIVAKIFVFVQFLQGSSGRVWVPVNFPMCPMHFHGL